MNIVIIPAFFQIKKNPTLGSFFMDQASALHKNGHNVSILYCDTYSVKCIKDFWQYDEDSVVETEGVNIYRKKYFCPLKHGMEGYADIFAKGILELYDKYIAGKKTDIIHAHCCVWAGYAAMKLSEKTGIPYVITEHATLFQLHKEQISSKNNKLIDKAFNNAKRLICVSKAFGELLSEYRKDIDIVGNVVNCDRFKVVDTRKSEKELKFLTVCYMTDEAMLNKKGIDILLIAWKNMSYEFPNARLTIGGGGQGMKKAVEWCKELDIEDSVKFVGKLSREDVAEKMQACDFFVLPSRYETFGVVYIEAFACGKPVIAARNGGPDDFVKDFNGILIEPDNVEALTNAMRKIINQRSKYEPEEIAAFARDNFSENAIAEQLEKIYNEVLVTV